MAQNGHYPLFFKEWIKDEQTKINYNDAKKSLKSTFTKLSRHRTLDKLQTAIISMDKESRDEFINSFLKVVEYNSLKEMNLLQ